MTPRALFRCSEVGERGWHAFSEPVGVLEACEPGLVPRVLEEVERATETGLHAVGWIAYEAASAFDPSLVTRPAERIPLARFALFRRRRRLADLGPPGGASPPSFDWRPTMSRPGHRLAVARIRRAIAEGELYQANLTFRLRSRWEGDSEDLFHDLYPRQPVPHAGWIAFDDLAVCSLSPELFLARDGEVLRSRPMKGTAGRTGPSEDSGEALARSAKERAENLMIVDMVRNDLGRVARPGSVVASRLFSVETYATVHQMTSTVEAWSDASLVEVLGALFPPASVTGAPKGSAMRRIAGLESTPRGVYTGTVGWIGPGRHAELNVAIRTLVVDRARGTAEYGVGGGIVWDSEAEAEYRECLAKAAILAPGGARTRAASLRAKR